MLSATSTSSMSPKNKSYIIRFVFLLSWHEEIPIKLMGRRSRTSGYHIMTNTTMTKGNTMIARFRALIGSGTHTPHQNKHTHTHLIRTSGTPTRLVRRGTCLIKINIHTHMPHRATTPRSIGTRRAMTREAPRASGRTHTARLMTTTKIERTFISHSF